MRVTCLIITNMHSKMHHYIVFLCLFAANNLNAEVLKVESIVFKAKKTNIDFGEPITLPFFSASQPKIAKKFNDYIYIDNLKILAPVKAKDGISRKINEADDDPIAGVTSMQYKVLLNNSKVLSLQFNSGFCGAYCEESATDYSFDATTGRHLTVQDIFTVYGIEMLKKKVYAARVATMQQEIKRLQKQATKPQKNNQQKDEFEVDANDAILLYKTCLIETAEMHKDEMKSGDTHELDYFSIDAKGLTFTYSRCSNQAMRALDSIDKFHNHYTFQSLKPYLTTYAKHLLFNKSAKFEQPTDITGQVFYGSIGLAPITFLIKPAEGYDRMLRATYFYNKYRRPIELYGTGSEWTEIDSKLKNQPKIITKWQAGIAMGEWRGNKVLPLKIAP